MTIRITAARTVPAAAALPPSVSLRRIFWMVLAALLAFIKAVMFLPARLLGYRGG